MKPGVTAMKNTLKTLAGAALAAMLALQTPAFAHGDADESAPKRFSR